MNDQVTPIITGPRNGEQATLWQKVGGPWYVVSLREFLLLTAPSGLLCGNWDFSSRFSRRCSHDYQIQVKSSSIATLPLFSGAAQVLAQEVRPRIWRPRQQGRAGGIGCMAYQTMARNCSEKN